MHISCEKVVQFWTYRRNSGAVMLTQSKIPSLEYTIGDALCITRLGFYVLGMKNDFFLYTQPHYLEENVLSKCCILSTDAVHLAK